MERLFKGKVVPVTRAASALYTAFPNTFNLKYKQEISFKNKKDATKNFEQIARLVIWLVLKKVPSQQMPASRNTLATWQTKSNNNK